MHIETAISLRDCNTFGLPATAATLVRITSEADVRQVVNHPELGPAPKFILGGGSNVVFTRDVTACLLKVEITGLRVVEERADAVIEDAVERVEPGQLQPPGVGGQLGHQQAAVVGRRGLLAGLELPRRGKEDVLDQHVVVVGGDGQIRVGRQVALVGMKVAGGQRLACVGVEGPRPKAEKR